MGVAQESIEEQLAEFEGREKRLELVKRYTLRKPMFYRTNDLIHSRRVAWITEDILSFAESIFGKDFDLCLASTLPHVHDDIEIATGDIEVCTKEAMSAGDMALKYALEVDAINGLYKLYPKSINGYRYDDLLNIALRKDTKEAQLVSLADKIDGFGEALHEVFAGNLVFMTEVNGVAPPCEKYTKQLSEFKKNFPLIAVLWDTYYGVHPAFTSPPPMPEFNFSCAKPHTPESVREDTGHSQYEFWKRITIENGGIGLLVERRE